VIAIDNIASRLSLAQKGGAETLNYDEGDVLEKLKRMTAGRGPDACIDAVGMEAHGTTVDAVYEYAKMALKLETDRPHALRQAIQACRKGGTVSIPGVYGGVVDKFPLGVAFSKGLSFRMGQTNVHKYLKPLMARVERGEIDPSFVITHRMTLDDGAQGYSTFDAQDGCIKVVMRP
jgi:threonine dehydrogenase-like Zn-dependent dehydrogenase